MPFPGRNRRQKALKTRKVRKTERPQMRILAETGPKRIKPARGGRNKAVFPNLRAILRLHGHSNLGRLPPWTRNETR